MTDLSMIRGDDATLDVAVTVEDGALAVTFTAKRAYRDADVDAILRKDLDAGVSFDEDGVHVDVEPADTRDLVTPLTLVWDLEVVDAIGLTATVASGYLAIAPDVTLESGFVVGSGSGS